VFTGVLVVAVATAVAVLAMPHTPSHSVGKQKRGRIEGPHEQLRTMGSVAGVASGVDDDRSAFDPDALDEFRPADGGDDDVGLSDDLRHAGGS